MIDPVLQLRPVTLHLDRGDGPLRGQVELALRAHGEPLRWAITAVASARLTVEAVVLA